MPFEIGLYLSSSTSALHYTFYLQCHAWHGSVDQHDTKCRCLNQSLRPIKKKRLAFMVMVKPLSRGGTQTADLGGPGTRAQKDNLPQVRYQGFRLGP